MVLLWHARSTGWWLAPSSRPRDAAPLSPSRTIATITFTKMIWVMVHGVQVPPLERPVRTLHLCSGYVFLQPALLFLRDPERFSGPGVCWSIAEKGERKKKEKVDISTIWNEKQMLWGFGGEVTGTWSPVCCAWRGAKRRQPRARLHAGCRLK